MLEERLKEVTALMKTMDKIDALDRTQLSRSLREAIRGDTPNE